MFNRNYIPVFGSKIAQINEADLIGPRGFLTRKGLSLYDPLHVCRVLPKCMNIIAFFYSPRHAL